MLALAKPFIQICLLRSSPQDLPPSGLLLGLALGAYTLTGIAGWMTLFPAHEAMGAALSSTLLLIGLTGSMLYMQRLKSRVVQTLTALAGTGALLQLVELPFSRWLAQADGPGESLPTLGLLAILVWSLAIGGHVLRHALSTVFTLGLLLAVVIYWLSASILIAMFPLPV